VATDVGYRTYVFNLRKAFGIIKVHHSARRFVSAIGFLDIGQCLEFDLPELGFGRAPLRIGLSDSRLLVVVHEERKLEYDSGGMVAAHALVLIADVEISPSQ